MYRKTEEKSIVYYKSKITSLIIKSGHVTTNVAISSTSFLLPFLPFVAAAVLSLSLRVPSRKGSGFVIFCSSSFHLLSDHIMRLDNFLSRDDVLLLLHDEQLLSGLVIHPLLLPLQVQDSLLLLRWFLYLVVLLLSGYLSGLLNYETL